MVSNFRYLSFKHPETSKAKTFQVLVGGRVLHFIVVATEPPVILFALGILYVSSGPLGSVYRLLLREKTAVKEIIPYSS
jgi:CDP-diacylglycerol--serine O-phosphatidyltransferase